MLRITPNAPVAEREKRRVLCWKRGRGRIVKIVRIGSIIAVRITRVRSRGWIMTARASPNVDLERLLA
jgi:hypothetical protein